MNTLAVDVDAAMRWAILVLSTIGFVLTITTAVIAARQKDLTVGDALVLQGLGWACLAISWATAELLFADSLPQFRLWLLLLAVSFVVGGLTYTLIDRLHGRSAELDDLDTRKPPEQRD